MRRWEEAGGPGWDHSVAGFKKKKSKNKEKKNPTKNQRCKEETKAGRGLLSPLCLVSFARSSQPFWSADGSRHHVPWGQVRRGSRVLARGLSAPAPPHARLGGHGAPAGPPSRPPSVPPHTLIPLPREREEAVRPRLSLHGSGCRASHGREGDV